MNIPEAVFMGIGLAMDALAVSLSLGAVGWSCPKTRQDTDPGAPAQGNLPWFRRLPFLSPAPAAPVCAVCRPHGGCSCECGKKTGSGHELFTWDRIVLTASLFGIFQAMMPTIGWFGSGLCGGLVQKTGRIAASLLLALVAVKMLREGFSKEDDTAKRIGSCSFRRLIVLSFATSIDALLVGVSYTCLRRTDIAGDVLVIGIVTALISAAGCVFGRMFGSRLGDRSSILGGVVLLGIAVKIFFFG